tara:strand:- start:585 stop:1268 length:684 start_codon:yes stop_codon:yes gene_type:complete
MNKKLLHLSIRGPSRRATLVLPANDHITGVVQRCGSYYERDLLDAIKRLNLPGVYVDVGAHFGNHTSYFALECPSSTVVAVEANPFNFGGLQQTVEANGIQEKVIAHNLAIHSTWTRVEPFYLYETNTGSGGVKESDEGPVEACTLDAVLSGLDNIAVIKIDAQFLDKYVVQSGLETIARWKPLLSIESSTSEEVREIQELIEPLGYQRGQRYASTPTYLWSAERKS